jgi:hypothetical protein
MNSNRIQFILKKDPFTRKVFDGFAYPDYPAKIKKFPSLIIFNTDSILGPGEHWCACFFINYKFAEFFDPYGMSPDLYQFTPIIKQHSEKIYFNEKPVQGLTADTCGHHVLFFSLHRARNIPSKTIMNTLYSNDSLKNDKMVFNYLQRFGKIMGEIDS